MRVQKLIAKLVQKPVASLIWIEPLLRPYGAINGRRPANTRLLAWALKSFSNEAWLRTNPVLTRGKPGLDWRLSAALVQSQAAALVQVVRPKVTRESPS